MTIYLGVGLLGHILTLITGKSFAQLLEEVIFQPLKMTESSTSKNSVYLTVGHMDNRPVAHWDIDAFAGAGAIRSNAEDMMRYVKAQMGLLSSPLQSAIDLTQQPYRQIDTTGRSRMGLGWLILSLPNDELFWHNGGTGGYRSFAGFSRKTNKAIVILDNSTEPMDELGMHFFDPSKKITPPKKAMKLSSSILQKYVGVYGDQPGHEFDVKLEGDHLLIQLVNPPYLKAYAESESRFFFRVEEASIAFFKNEKGVIDRYRYGECRESG